MHKNIHELDVCVYKLSWVPTKKYFDTIFFELDVEFIVYALLIKSD